MHSSTFRLFIRIIILFEEAHSTSFIIECESLSSEKKKKRRHSEKEQMCQVKIQMIAVENAALMEIKMNAPSKQPISECYCLLSFE